MKKDKQCPPLQCTKYFEPASWLKARGASQPEHILQHSIKSFFAMTLVFAAPSVRAVVPYLLLTKISGEEVEKIGYSLV